MTLRRTVVLIGAGVVWFGVVVAGLAGLMVYDNRPGAAAEPPHVWPAESRLAANPHGPTLLMFAHPRCDCTRASIDELAELMARATVPSRTYVVFIKPGRVEGGWERTAVWRKAAGISGVEIARDDLGHEARRFGVQTSGQVLVYDRAGRLLFSGGTTGARGKTGNNMGRMAILAALEAEQAQSTTPVFGCSMFTATDRADQPEANADPLPFR